MQETKDPKPSTNWKDKIFESAKIISAMTVIMGALWVFLGPVQQYIQNNSAIQQELQADNVEILEILNKNKELDNQQTQVLEEISDQIETLTDNHGELLQAQTELSKKLEETSGETRVITQGEQLSYVKEPVYLGDPITLVLYIGRTEVGQACVLRDIVPIFKDANGIIRSGNIMIPTDQFGIQIERREIIIDQPPNLAIGQTTLILQLHYTCGEQDIYEETNPVLFTIEEK
jgi:hypothetical protein